jgi:hypothetical protein
MNAEALLPLFDALAEAVAAKVVEQLRAGDVGMIDQTKSPLGGRRHIAAVRRLVAAGEHGAAIVGRRYLLSKERLDAELTGSVRALKPGNNNVQLIPVVDELSALRERFAKVGS